MPPSFWSRPWSCRCWRPCCSARCWCGARAAHSARHPDRGDAWRAVRSHSRCLAQCMGSNAFAVVEAASCGCVRQLRHYRCPAFAHGRGIPINGLLQSPTPSPGYRPRPPPIPHAYPRPSRDPGPRPASCFWLNTGDPTSVERTDPGEHLPLGKPCPPTTRRWASRGARPGCRACAPADRPARVRAVGGPAGRPERRAGG